jgi:alkylation response protein AidB-like acyl-CoA dehydrogenase
MGEGLQTEAHRAFRDEVRAFLATEWRPEMARNAAAVAAFRRRAVEQGYLYRGFPRALGGSEQPTDPLRLEIIRQEFAMARAPREVTGLGVSMVAPTLLEWGTEEQKQRFIPPTLAGEITWAQGYSEPGSGSDLASLVTKAELVDGEWVVNGHKIWTSNAFRADWFFVLARTEPAAPKHQGISYLLIQARQSGIEIKRIRQISGKADFCEVFFEDVRTPADLIVGERGAGWTVSRTTLKHERNMVGSAAGARELFDRLLRLAERRRIDGRPALEDPVLRQRLVTLEGFVESHIASNEHQLLAGARGEEPPLLGQLNKITSTNIADEVAQIAMDLMGEDLLRAADPDTRSDAKWQQQVLGSLGLAIAGGTSNIQRNVIAERGLGLPRDEGAAQ